MESTVKQGSWHGPKQVKIMIYSGLMFAIGSCLVSGFNNTIFPWIAEANGWDVFALMRLGGYSALLTPFGVILTTKLIDRFGVKLVNTISLILAAIVMFLLGFAPGAGYGFFVALILIIGFLGGSYFMASNSALTANWWPTKKGIVLGFTTLGVMIQNIFWTPFMPSLFNSLGYSTTMICVAVFILLVALFGAFFTKGTPEEEGQFPDGEAHANEDLNATIKALKEYKSDWTIGRLLKDKGVWGISLGMGLVWMANMAYICSITPRMLAFGYDFSLAQLVQIICGISACVGSWALGVVDQKVGTKKACIIFAVLCLVGTILAYFMPVSGVALWISALIFFGSNGAVMNLVPSACAQRFGRWDYTAAYTVIGFITALTSGAGIVLTGLFQDYAVLNTCAIVLDVIGILIIIFVMKLNLVGKAD